MSYQLANDGGESQRGGWGMEKAKSGQREQRARKFYTALDILKSGKE